MRAFIALELAGEIKKELSRLEGELRNTGAGVKWVTPENIHLTLKFLGDIEEERTEGIKKSLDGISSEEKSFEVNLFKLGAFPALDNPRVVWVGIDKGCAEVEKIAKRIEEDLEKLGFPKEERPFSAHLTLGRIKSPKNKSVLTEKLLTLEVLPKSCTVKSINLFKSTLTPEGPIYETLHEAKFTDG